MKTKKFTPLHPESLALRTEDEWENRFEYSENTPVFRSGVTGFSYKKAGVDIDKADEFVERIAPLVATTNRSGCIGGIGGFGGLFSAKFKGLKDPVLVSGTDGVGTKLLLAEIADKYDTVGIDLVAMSVNDVLTSGAEPLFFLDYLAIGKLRLGREVELIKGIVAGCRSAGCALIGGETAELPGMYEKGKFDLAGFCVGVVDKDEIIDGRGVKVGDILLGIQSNGLHSNGFSLVRKLFSKTEAKGKWRGELLKPTRIYVKPVLNLMKKVKIKAIAHVTGGGFPGNIPRVLPAGMTARIKRNSWFIPGIFKEIERRGNIDEGEMFRTFNMGIGMVLVISPSDVASAKRGLAAFGLKSWPIGNVNRGKEEIIIS